MTFPRLALGLSPQPVPITAPVLSPGDLTDATDAPSARLAALRDIVDNYRTCELATLNRSGTPIAWPAVCILDPDTGSIVLTTSIALPRKAFNIRRDPRVALLFSDPTGSGRTDRPHVLVRGTATCPDEIHTGPDGLEEYWRRLAERQPASGGYGANAVGRWLSDWYYMRLVITVTAQEVSTRATPVVVAPEAMETGSRFGFAGPRMPAPPRADRSPYAAAVRRLPAGASAVLAIPGGDGPPSLQRVRLHADPDARRFVLAGTDDGQVLRSGQASLLVHSHDEALGSLRQWGLVGELDATGDGWAFRPDRLLPGTEARTPIAIVRTMLRLRRTAQAYLDRRGLDRPRVDWAGYRRAAEVAPAG